MIEKGDFIGGPDVLFKVVGKDLLEFAVIGKGAGVIAVVGLFLGALKVIFRPHLGIKHGRGGLAGEGRQNDDQSCK
jgi:hypothetical protein